ncbi:MAG TPA: hypothetical protein VHB25_19370 [Gemmatimonadaceae bacterium]|nr:hypothetical protein [Gemmatimonadaceae bacterium]
MKSIADVVSGSGLAFYAEVALILFLLVFLVVGLRVLFGDKGTLDEAARLPLEDDEQDAHATTPSPKRASDGSTHDDA